MKIVDPTLNEKIQNVIDSENTRWPMVMCGEL